MPRDEATSESQEPIVIKATKEVRIAAIYQRNGAVALTRSQLFDSTTEVQALIAWAKSFEDLDIEFIRLETDAE